MAKALAVGVHIGTLGRQHNRLHAAVTQEVVERVGEFAVTVMNEMVVSYDDIILGVTPIDPHRSSLSG